MLPSFFKIFLEPSSPHLALPHDFISMQLKNKIPKSPIIQTANGGYSWKLRIKKIGESYCFANKWDNVVKDTELGFGDFIYFRLVGQSIFKMWVYSPNGCEKILSPKVDHNGVDDDEEDDPCFTVIFTKQYTQFLRFPGGFAESAGINGERTMIVKNLDGKEWVTGLKFDNSYRYSIRYLLSPGWRCFFRENDLSEGDECVFKFIKSEDKLLLAKVSKNKWPPRESPMIKVVKRARGGQTHEHGDDVDGLDRPLEMPRKRLCGSPPQQKSHVLYF